MKLQILILVMLLIPLSATAKEKSKWTTLDTVLQLTYTTLHVMDWSQTLHISRNHDKFSEANAILGPYPSEGKINVYFATTLALHCMASYYLSKPYRTIFQITWIAIQYNRVQHNRNIGIGINFHF